MVRRVTFMVFILALFQVLGANAKNVTVESFEIAPGETVVFAINFSNTKSVHVAFQCDVQLPEGLTINKEQCYLSSRCADSSQKLYVGELDDGLYRFVTTSFALQPITGNSGPLIYVSVTADNSYQGGTVTISNTLSVDSSSKKYTLNDETVSVKKTSALVGDVNQDGFVTVADVMTLINYVVSMSLTYDPLYDINGDGVVNITDVAVLASILVQNNFE